MAITTKEQERKALEKIRKIVDDLGPESYLAFAFEGCFEDAEQNIEWDCACSYKSRFETATKKIEELQSFNDRIQQIATENEKKLNERIKVLEDQADTMNGVVVNQQEMIANGFQKIMKPDEYKKLYVLVDDSIEETKEKIMNAASAIAFSETGSEEYEKAVSGMTGLFEKKKNLDGMLEYLEEYGKMIGA